MGGITDAHVEWAIVNRLKAMLDAPPPTDFNVTQTFALFSAVLLWTKQRGWVAGDNAELRPNATEADRRAHAFRQGMRGDKIVDDPWRLPQVAPRLEPVEDAGDAPRPINVDFHDMTAEAFFRWLRDALAHGDGRNILPLHKESRRDGRTLLAGFRVQGRNGPQRLILHLHHDDMRRLGSVLADRFCTSLSGGEQYFEKEAGTARIAEAARVA